MEPGPPKIIERIAGWLIPPACREEVLGDLRERYESPWRYAAEAVHTILCVVYSRIRRTTDPVVALMEAMSLYTSYVIAAFSLDRAALFDDRGFARPAIPAAIVLAIVVLADAYSNPRRRWALKPLFAPIAGIAAAAAWEMRPDAWALPHLVFVWGSGMGALLISTLRMMFPPVTERPQASGAPAFWQKLELSPLALRLKDALLPAVIMLAVIILLLARQDH